MITKVEFSKEVGGVLVNFGQAKRNSVKTVIISTGATAKYLGLEDEKKYSGGGVSACAKRIFLQRQKT